MELTKELLFFSFAFLDNQPRSQGFYLDGKSPGNEFGALCYSDTGIPAFWASPFPKP